MGVPNFYSWLIKRYPMAQYEWLPQDIDYLYLDMNQVIYRCALNPNILFKDYLRDRQFEEVWTLIINYLDSIITLVKPKVLFMAFDGTAPRSKMNQQRQRRFASSKSDQKMQNLLVTLGLEQKNLTFKNNQISPGTDFMYELNQQLEFYIKRKIFEDKAFQNIQVIFSGSNHPGEGEHKMLDFIRSLRKSPNFDEKSTHLIYSADADLIILGLSLHLENIAILRETQTWDSGKLQVAAQRVEEVLKFQVINLKIVREYLDLEYSFLKEKMKIEYDINRIIDDFVLIFYFVGNDFLPRIFCFNIREGSVELLLKIFKQFLENTNAYITQDGLIQWRQFKDLVQRLKEFENKAMEEKLDDFKKRLREDDVGDIQRLYQEQGFIEEMKQNYEKNEGSQARKKFYLTKCYFDIETQEGKQKLDQLVKDYLTGLQYTLLYYYKTIPSWTWFYPQYYAPVCFDIEQYVNEDSFNIQFEKGEPIETLTQLMMILTPHNRALLPNEYAKLLEHSMLREPYDFYPSEFEIDPYGAVWDHQFINKIPFMDYEVVKQALKQIDKTKLSERDILRNIQIKSKLFFKGGNKKLVQTQLPSVFQDFELDYEELDLDFNNMQLIDLIASKVPRHQENISLLPSLNILKINQAFLKQDKTKYKTVSYLQLQFNNIGFNYIDSFNKNKQYHNPVFAYCGYPLQKYGEIICIVSKQTLLFFLDYGKKDLVDVREGDSHQQIFEKYVELLQIECSNKKINYPEIQVIAVVNYYKEILRKSDGSYYFNERTSEQKPVLLEWVSQKKLINLIDYSLPKEEFKVNDQVLFFHNENQQFDGSFGKIFKVFEKLDYIVQIQRLPSKVEPLKKLEEQFYTTQYSSQKLGIAQSTLLRLLENVNVVISKKQNKDLADCYDIGFNVIDKYTKQLVPELVRISGVQSNDEKFNYYHKLEISQRLMESLQEYVKRNQKLVKHLDSLDFENLRKFKSFNLHSFFDSEIELLQTYIFVLTLPISKYRLCHVASDQISAQQIKEYSNTKPKEQQVDLKAISSSGLLIKQYYQNPQPYMNEAPQFHQLGDRVVAINEKYTEFGSYGTIVGIVDDSEKINVEVLWDNARFGHNDLNGRCPLLRGSIVEYLDVFNLTQKWSKSLRKCLLLNVQKGWDYKISFFKTADGKVIDRLSKFYITPLYRYSQVHQHVELLNTVKAAVFDVLNEQTEWRKEKLSETATFEELGFDQFDSDQIAVQVEDRLNLDEVFQFDRSFTSVSETIRYFYDELVKQHENEQKYKQELELVEKNAIQFLKEHDFLKQIQFTENSTFTELGFEFFKTCQLIENLKEKLNIFTSPLDNLDVEKISDIITLLKKQKLQELVYQEKLQKSKEVQQADTQEHATQHHH